jgi:hypothetical protein
MNLCDALPRDAILPQTDKPIPAMTGTSTNLETTINIQRDLPPIPCSPDMPPVTGTRPPEIQPTQSPSITNLSRRSVVRERLSQFKSLSRQATESQKPYSSIFHRQASESTPTLPDIIHDIDISPQSGQLSRHSVSCAQNSYITQPDLPTSMLGIPGLPEEQCPPTDINKIIHLLYRQDCTRQRLEEQMLALRKEVQTISTVDNQAALANTQNTTPNTNNQLAKIYDAMAHFSTRMAKIEGTLNAVGGKLEQIAEDVKDSPKSSILQSIQGINSLLSSEIPVITTKLDALADVHVSLSNLAPSSFADPVPSTNKDDQEQLEGKVRVSLYSLGITDYDGYS